MTTRISMLGKGAATARAWSMRWVALIRLILYFVIVAFLFQLMYFGEREDFVRPAAMVWLLSSAFVFSLAVMAAGGRWRRVDAAVAFTFAVDIVAVTGVVVSSGGFNSIFLSFYLPLIFMASAWLPRRFTAVFPSVTTLGLAYISLGHLAGTLDGVHLPGAGLMANARQLEASTVVSTLLIFSVLFFVVAYLAGMLGQGLFVEQRLNATILETMTEGVAVVKKDWRLVYVNSEFLRIFPGARPGGSFLPIARALFSGAEGEGDDFAGAMPRTEDAVVTLVPPDPPPGAPDGRPPVEVRVSAIRLREGRGLDGLLFLVTDLTLRRRMEQAESGLEKHLAISAMAAGLAHEIRNPLASMRGAIQEMGRSFPGGSENRMLADVVLAESDRLDKVVGRFLDFSREGKLRLSRKRLSALVRDVRTMLSRSHEGADVAVDVRVLDDPEVNCDSDRVMEVFFNLALNACQLAPHPGGKLDITLRADDRLGRKGVEVLFEDNGPGFVDKDQSRLFAPFFTNRSGGTGMGLAFSRKQTTMHGGTIDAENRPGGGARFSVWLPLEQGGGGSVSGRLAHRGTQVFKK